MANLVVTPTSLSNSARKIIVLSYDGCLTGSAELRILNAVYVSGKYKDINDDSTYLQKYSYDYDHIGGKR